MKTFRITIPAPVQLRDHEGNPVRLADGKTVDAPWDFNRTATFLWLNNDDFAEKCGKGPAGLRRAIKICDKIEAGVRHGASSPGYPFGYIDLEQTEHEHLKAQVEATTYKPAVGRQLIHHIDAVSTAVELTAEAAANGKSAEA